MSYTDLEMKEIIEKLRKHGLGKFVDVFFENDSKMYTKRGRLNKSGACRVFDYKTKQLEDIFEACREILKKEFD